MLNPHLAIPDIDVQYCAFHPAWTSPACVNQFIMIIYFIHHHFDFNLAN
jgi:hypothetical protein